MKTIKWGILGTGYIANLFAEAMIAVDPAEHEKSAVCATSLEKAQLFCKQHGFNSPYSDFDAMLKDTKPNIVYIAVPNLLHYQFVMKALERGSHVLCEKPMADNAKQLREMLDKAKEKDLFLMEGMWTRCFPAVRKIREWLREGKIGKIKAVRADFGLKAVEGWQGWKASAAHGGGAVRDVGIYTIAWAFLAYPGEVPRAINSVYRIKDGADFHSELLFRYSGDRTAFLTGSFDMVTDHTVSIYGDQGVITAGPKHWCPKRAEIFKYHPANEFQRKLTERYEDDYPFNGMQYEITHAGDCIRTGKKESELFTAEESLGITRIIDSLRREWGVRYPSD
ncbi:MAG: Gfo/Idh/MocA family oxidoreductase [Treponema sp.]|jgi:predicted dehydrogenase|nr:Gfo/Idh/MocA family oxidoreductase [Treponema sp.]